MGKSIMFMVAIVFASTVAQAQSPFLLKANSALIQKIQKEGSADVLIKLGDQPDLSGAEKIKDRTQRIQYVVDRLKGAAEKSQRMAMQLLKSHPGEVKPFYIENVIAIKKADAKILNRLAVLKDVKSMLIDFRSQLSLPKIDKQTDFSIQKLIDVIPGNLSAISVTRVWHELGVKGKGIVVAGQDTGYDWQHPALKKQYRGFNNGTVDHNYNWHDAISTSRSQNCPGNMKEPCDDSDHGTHTMGTMVGDDGGENKIGVAPEAKWIGCRNMDEGVGTASSYLECFEFFLAPYKLGGNSRKDGRAEKAPHIINNSWGCPSSEGCSGPEFIDAVKALKKAGIFVVVSVGNEGPSCGSAGDPPGSYSGEILAVGAYNNWSNKIADFSSRGPSAFNGGIGPEIVAPGVSIRSSVPLWVNSDGYDEMSGTSMAGPHMAGVAALLWSAKPELIGQVQASIDLIDKTATPKLSNQNCGRYPGSQVPNAVFGHGLIDAYELIR